nr:MAG TPA: hypothetical protein [Caudoviricetes sp.]
MNYYKQTDKYTWMLQQFSADFEIALNEPSAMLDLKDLILLQDKDLLDDIQMLGELARRLTDGSVKIIEEYDRPEILEELRYIDLQKILEGEDQ